MRGCEPEIERPHNCRVFRKRTGNEDGLEILDEIGEDVTDGRPEQRQNDNNDDGNEHQNKCIFYEALAFFTRHVQHC